MGLLGIFAVAALLTIVNVLAVRSFIARQASVRWWRVMAAAWLVGAVLGVRSGFFFEYQPHPKMRVIGAPIPAVAFQWEGPPGKEQWVDYIMPVPLLFAGSNVVILALLAGCPVGSAFWLYQRFLAESKCATFDL